jgi:hypothetical protein
LGEMPSRRLRLGRGTAFGYGKQGKNNLEASFCDLENVLPRNSRDRLQVVTNSIYDDNRPRRQSQQEFAKVQVLIPFLKNNDFFGIFRFPW